VPDVAPRSPVRPIRIDLAGSVLVLWTWFVWGGRVRNALGDPELQGAALTRTLMLASSFVLLATALAVLVARDRAGAPAAAARVGLTWVLAAWTTGVWGVRAVAIAASGEHAAGFVAVHVVLAAVSIGLAAWAVWAVGRTGRAGSDDRGVSVGRRSGELPPNIR
jgi:hypothetical protein